MLMNCTFKRHNVERRAEAGVYSALCALGLSSLTSNPFGDRLGQQPASINNRQHRH
jgi:hypothetical protein